MLRLEKGRRSDPVAIRLRQKDRLFTRTFTVALAIAVTFHLSLFVLFKIQPFNMGSSYRFPPVSVESALPNTSHIALEINKNQDDEDVWLLLRDNPVMPKQDAELFRDKESRDALALPSSFIALEERYIGVPSTATAESTRRLQLFVSGPLSARELLSRVPESIIPTNGKKLTSLEARYQVQIDPETGSLFWYDKSVSTGQMEIDVQLEKILSTLRFSTEPLLEHLTGEIHFIMMVDE